MATARRPPYLIVLGHFKYCVDSFEQSINMYGKTPHWTGETISRQRVELRLAGQMVRSMALRPSERDAALTDLKKHKARIEALLTSHRFGSMNKRWFSHLLRRVAAQ
jgi:hypothetical protein